MTATPRTILAVDDEVDITEMLSVLLEGEGYRVLIASGGAEALSILETERPDLVLLDIMMPEVDGHQVCSGIRARPGLQDVPVLMLTAKNDIAHIAQAVDEGADGFIVKPFQVDQFLQAIKLRLEGKPDEFYRSASGEGQAKQLADKDRILYVDLIEPEDCFSVVINACRDQDGTLLSLSQDEISSGELQTTALVRVGSSAHFGELLNRVLETPGVRILNCFLYRGFSEVPTDLIPRGDA